MTLSAFQTVANAITEFGEYKEDFANDALNEFQGAILNYAESIYGARDNELRSPLSFRGAVFQAIRLFDPKFSEKNPGQIAIYADADKRARAIRTSGKPGKMLRKIIPFMTDSETATLVDILRADYPVSGFTIAVYYQDREKFRFAYLGSNYAPMQNPRTSYARKSLATSCMRYSFNHLSAHPCEIYASEDFKLIVALDNKGRVAGRVLVNVRDSENPTHAPLYGVSESALDALQAALDAMGASDADCWHGARLLRIEDDNGFIAPYLDVSPQNFDDYGDCLKISRHGDYSGSETSGIAYSENSYFCDDCGCRVHDDDIYCPEYGDGTYCESCYHDRFTICENCHDTTPCEDVSAVYMTGYRGRITSESWCSYCCDNHATRIDSGDYWKDDETLETADGSIISQEEFESEYFICDFSDEIWHHDSRAETVDGESVYIEILRHDENWQLQDSGLWELIQTELPFDSESVPVLCAPVPVLCAPVPVPVLCAPVPVLCAPVPVLCAPVPVLCAPVPC